jgi:hypothetical protein
MVTVDQVESEMGTVEKAQLPNPAQIIKIEKRGGKAQPTNLSTIKTTKFTEPSSGDC